MEELWLYKVEEIWAQTTRMQHTWEPAALYDATWVKSTINSSWE
jgi:hypothetical protein